MKTRNIKVWLKGCFWAIILLFPVSQSFAQLNTMGTGYFRNLYLFNPAMAGMQETLQLNAGLRQQFSTMPGSPVMQAVSADYRFAKKAAMGIALNNDRAGILKHTRIAGTYAYHLPLNADHKQLHFGVSLVFSNDRLDHSELQGNIDDPDVAGVNLRETYMDGDFGAAYTSDALQLQFALPNMKRLFKKDSYAASDRPLFFSSVSYRLPTGLGIVEPKLVYRSVEGYDHLIDAGANFELNLASVHKLNAFALYHSTKSATFGLGINWNTFGINGMYTTSTSPVQGYVNGDFEISVSYGLYIRK